MDYIAFWYRQHNSKALVRIWYFSNAVPERIPSKL